MSRLAKRSCNGAGQSFIQQARCSVMHASHNERLQASELVIKRNSGPTMAFPLLVQVALGISTLMLNVPVSLGSLHQANAMALLSLVIASLFVLRPSAITRQSVAIAVSSIQQNIARSSLRPVFA